MRNVLWKNKIVRRSALLLTLLVLAVTVTGHSTVQASWCPVMTTTFDSTEVYSEPSVFAPVINYLDAWYYFASDGYVVAPTGVFYRIQKHAPGGEWTIGTGYVLASDLVIPYRCSEAPVLREGPGGFTPAR